MLRRLLKVTDSTGVGIDLHHRIQSLFGECAFVCLQSNPFQHLRQCKSGENDLLLLRCVIRDVDHRKTRHQWSTDLLLVIGSGDGVDTKGGNGTFHIVVRESQIVKQCQKHIRRIAVTLAVCRLVQLIDDEYQIRLSRHGKSLHDNARLGIGIDSGASGQLLRIVNGTHV